MYTANSNERTANVVVLMFCTSNYRHHHPKKNCLPKYKITETITKWRLLGTAYIGLLLRNNASVERRRTLIISMVEGVDQEETM